MEWILRVGKAVELGFADSAENNFLAQEIVWDLDPK